MGKDRLTSSHVSTDPDAARRASVAFFDRAYHAYQQAARSAGGAVSHTYDIAGYCVRLCFAGPALVPFITPALQHLAGGATEEPQLTICLWDSASTQTPMPEAPWSSEDYLPGGLMRGANDNGLHTAFNLGSGVLAMLDGARHLGLFWIRDAGALPYYETATPLRTSLFWWMRLHGRVVVHAGAVGHKDGGVLLIGKGGSGKSTAALACVNAGMLYAGDNNLLLSEPPRPFAFSLYNTITLHAEHMRRRFPDLLARASNSADLDTEKALVFLHQVCPDRLARGFPIVAICLPKVANRTQTRLVRASPAAALLALAPSSIFPLPGADQTSLEWMGRFVQQVPCYVLELGTDLSQIPRAVSDLLADHSP